MVYSVQVKLTHFLRTRVLRAAPRRIIYAHFLSDIYYFRNFSSSIYTTAYCVNEFYFFRYRITFCFNTHICFPRFYVPILFIFCN